MPLRRHLRRIIVMLRKVNPSVATWNFVFGVQVLKVPVAELVTANQRAGFGITDVLHLMPPLLYARSTYISNIPSKRHHVVVGESDGVCLDVFGPSFTPEVLDQKGK